MDNGLVVEILLAVLALMIGVGSFLGAGRANKSAAVAVPIPPGTDADAEAFEVAKSLYLSSIEELRQQVISLREEVQECRTENARLRSIMLRKGVTLDE